MHVKYVYDNCRLLYSWTCWISRTRECVNSECCDPVICKKDRPSLQGGAKASRPTMSLVSHTGISTSYLPEISEYFVLARWNPNSCICGRRNSHSYVFKWTHKLDARSVISCRTGSEITSKVNYCYRRRRYYHRCWGATSVRISSCRSCVY